MWKTRWKVWITLGDGGFPRGDGGELCLRLFCIKDAETGWPAGEDPRPSVWKGGIKMQERRRPMQGRRRGYGSWTAPFGSEVLRDGRPGVPPLRFYERAFEQWAGGSGTRPYGGYKTAAFFS